MEGRAHPAGWPPGGRGGACVRRCGEDTQSWRSGYLQLRDDLEHVLLLLKVLEGTFALDLRHQLLQFPVRVVPGHDGLARDFLLVGMRPQRRQRRRRRRGRLRRAGRGGRRRRGLRLRLRRRPRRPRAGARRGRRRGRQRARPALPQGPRRGDEVAPPWRGPHGLEDTRRHRAGAARDDVHHRPARLARVLERRRGRVQVDLGRLALDVHDADVAEALHRIRRGSVARARAVRPPDASHPRRALHDPAQRYPDVRRRFFSPRSLISAGPAIRFDRYCIFV